MPAVLGADQVPAQHLLAVPDGVTPADISSLVLSRFPEASVLDGGARQVIEVLPGCAIDGPWAPPPELPDWVGALYRLVAPEQRGDAVPPELRGRGDILDAFPEGEPVAEERQLVELAMAIARRVGGAVRVAGEAGRVLEPSGRPDLILYSEVWLHPEALVHVLADAFPGLTLQHDEGEPVLPPDAVTATSLLTDEGERRWLHAEAEAYDTAALAEPDVTESYGALTTIDDVVYSVAVEAALGVPIVLSGIDWSGPILYELRCYPPGADDAPPSDAVERIDTATRALLDAVGGHVVDDDGFLVDPGT